MSGASLQRPEASERPPRGVVVGRNPLVVYEEEVSDEEATPPPHSLTRETRGEDLPSKGTQSLPPPGTESSFDPSSILAFLESRRSEFEDFSRKRRTEGLLLHGSGSQSEDANNGRPASPEYRREAFRPRVGIPPNPRRLDFSNSRVDEDLQRILGPEHSGDDYLSTAFTREIRDFSIPEGFKLPKSIPLYSGNSDPLDHLSTFKDHMTMHRAPKEMMCRAFPTFLVGKARIWFEHIQPGSIGSFYQLSRAFTTKFVQ